MGAAVRKVIELSSEYYEATSRNGLRDFGDYLGTSEDYFFNSSTRQTAIGRLRREVRNNPYLAGLYAKYPEAVGYGEPRIRTPDTGFNALADTLFYRWGKKVTPDGDSLRALQSLRLHEDLVAGEIFLVLLASGRVQVIPSEFCGSPFDAGQLEDGERNGILYHPSGAVKAYRFGRMTPTGLIDYNGGAIIPARYVIHDFNRDRVLMGRGLPRLLPSLGPARDLFEITRAIVKKVKDSSKFLGSIESDQGLDALRKLGVQGLDPLAEATEAEANPGDEAADAPAKRPVRVKLEDGTFILLEPGEKLNLLESKYPATDVKGLVLNILHAVSAPIGLPVELWFSGLGEVNYSGFKGLGVQWDSRRKALKKDAEERVLERLIFWRLSKFLKEGDLPQEHPTGDLDQFEFRWAKTAVLDEEKAAAANAKRLDSGEITVADLWEDGGLFPEEVFAARRELWIKLQKAAGHLDPDADGEDVEVPEIFLWRGRLPGEPETPTAEAAPAAPGQDNPPPTNPDQ